MRRLSLKAAGLWLALTLILIACEPLAPEVQQQIIIITDAPTSAPFGDILPPTPTPRPTLEATSQPSPSPTLLPTATVPPCDETRGSIIESNLKTALNPDPLPYRVYLPPCFFESGRRYPYLILLHQSGANHQQWTDLGLQVVLDGGISGGTLAPMMAIMLDGGALLDEREHIAGGTLEDVILSELIPEVESLYCLWTAKAGRAIGGISRGGFWALSIALRHPDQFISVGGHSPRLLPDNAPTSHNPLSLAESAVGLGTLRIWVDHARADEIGANVLNFSNTLRAREIAHAYPTPDTGGHTNDYWRVQLPAYLKFYSDIWPQDVRELPSCQVPLSNEGSAP